MTIILPKILICEESAIAIKITNKHHKLHSKKGEKKIHNKKCEKNLYVVKKRIYICI